MNADQRRSGRINSLYKLAKRGKHDWNDLMKIAMSIPVTRATAKQYLDAVEAQLKKEGHL